MKTLKLRNEGVGVGVGGVRRRTLRRGGRRTCREPLSANPMCDSGDTSFGKRLLFIQRKKTLCDKFS